MDSLARILNFAKCNKHVQESLDIVERSLLRYKVEDTCISFNGGKDCTVILHLVHSVLSRRFCSGSNNPRILTFYAQLPDHFEEESKFVNDVVTKYNLELMMYTSNSLKESLFRLQADAPNIEALFLGTRNDDLKPGTRLETFAPTDSGWPKFMRVNPILNWSYFEVWEFIRRLDLPYCDLYNQGYSSVGTKSDTGKNSSLLRYDENGEPYYLPAWSLKGSHEERLYRSTSSDTNLK